MSAGERKKILDDDKVLSANEIKAKYAEDGEEHPVFYRVDWRNDVAMQYTILGYWQWLVEKIEGETS